MTLTSFGVVGGEERVVARVVLKVGDEVPEGGSLVVVTNRGHDDLILLNQGNAQGTQD